MLLPHDSAMRFIDGYKAVLLRVLSNTGTVRSRKLNADLAAARTLGAGDRGLFEQALSDLADSGAPVESGVADAIRSLQVGRWWYLRQGKTAAIFLDASMQDAYAVRCLTTPLDEMLDEPPLALETGVFRFEGHFVCDGLVLDPVLLGPGYRADLNATYTRLRQAGRFHAKDAASAGSGVRRRART